MNKFLNNHPKLQMFCRKRVLSLKRNYYSLPFIIICIACFFYLCCMFIINKSVDRCDHKYTAIYLFVSVLTSILSIVAIVSYTKKIYGQKRPLKMLIIYFVIVAICLVFTILIFYFNEVQIKTEITKRDALPVRPDGTKLIEWYTYQTYVNYGICTRALLIVFLVLEVIANGLLIGGPWIDKKLQTIHFDNNNNEINNYQKRGFIKNLPFGLKATFIKYWFYGALYFFCFMGLGYTGISNENLVLVTGLIGGVLFDIALYNIFLLFAETREEASKWWIFKSKKVYSILINIVVIIGILFAFYYIIVPIKANMPKDSSFAWLFQEPLTAAILLTILDTALCWIKNGAIILFKKIFKLGKDDKTKESHIKILDVSPVSVTIEVNTGGNYYANKPYNVFLNNEVILKKINTNVLTIYDLKPDTQYKLMINRSNITFNTAKISKFYKAFEGNDLQTIIDDAEQYSLIVVNKGTYQIKSLSLKNNIVLYLRKGVILIPSNNINDYPIIPPFYQSNKNEIYGVYQSKASKIRQAIFNIDHLSNVRIIGEAIVDGSSLDALNNIKDSKNVLLPYLMFINHSTNISIVGLTIKNSLEYAIHSFFSNNIDLLDLNISSIKQSGIIAQCSSNINIIGGIFSNNIDAINIKSGDIGIANLSHTPCKDVFIKNLLIESSDNAFCVGNNLASGVSNINVSNICIKKIKCAFNLKTNLNMGKESIIKDININNIDINDVLTPFIINAYDNYDNNAVKTDNGVPYLDNFIFNNIKVKDYEICAGIFYGLNKRYIDEIKFINCSFIAKENAKEDYPLIMKDITRCSKCGFIVNNVRTFNLQCVSFTNLNGNRINANNVGEIIDK